MKKREYAQLLIYEVQENAETILLEVLRKLYMTKTSEVVYVVKKNRLYGIVCLGDVLRNNGGEVIINTNFFSLKGFNVVKAHEVFWKKKNINKIPVINEKGELLGDYSRWDDMLFLERNYIWFAKEGLLSRILMPYKRIYIVEPEDDRDFIYAFFRQCMDQLDIRYDIIKKSEFVCTERQNTVFVFLNEDEKRGIQCLERVCGNECSFEGKEWITYKQLLLTAFSENSRKLVKELGMISKLPDKNIDEKASLLFMKLKEKGVRCLSICADNRESTEYVIQFQEALERRLKDSSCLIDAPWLTGETAEKFWGILYQKEDYRRGIVQKELEEAWRTGRFKNLNGRYCIMKNGRRNTCYQPDEYIGTIYFLGPCMMFGAYVEDCYTIESYLQKKLMEMGYPYKVENYASPLRIDAELENRLEEIGKYSQNDIVVYLSQIGEVAGIQNYSLWEIYEEYGIPADWVTNYYVHCNWQVNQIIAAKLFTILKPLLSLNGKQGENIHFDFRNVMKKYIYKKYIRRYFEEYLRKEHGIVGAIVMNCNPFSNGHRYLIEQAQSKVDFLIIFVVEEDSSLFSFEERYRMVVEGIKDMGNVMVVPSGEFILSKNTFQEYFTKMETESIRLNAEYDIKIFADYIAAPLRITYRFAGEEPIDKVTKIYNEAMSKILPHKGISFVEIPRIKMAGGVVSASRVRENLRCGEYDTAAALLPETTLSFLLR